MFRSLSGRLARRARARDMHRRLEELDRIDRLALSHPGRSPRRPGSGLRTPVILLIAAALTLAVIVLNPMSGGRYLREALGLTRHGPSVAVPHNGGRYAFVTHQTDGVTPVGWDPCQPIHYAVNPAEGPADWEQLVASAVRVVAADTGLDFVSDGQTDAIPFAMHQGSERGPVVIGWQSPQENESLAGDVAGVGGSAATSTPSGRLVYVRGSVALDAGWFTAVQPRPHALAQQRAVLMHELGHVVGLAHVQSRRELMNAHNVGLTTFGPGDLEGLARLGNIPCG
ncbi:MAG: matrixin family metalloprotease [Nocardioides sp.]